MFPQRQHVFQVLQELARPEEAQVTCHISKVELVASA
jgi:hypothetical protein